MCGIRLDPSPSVDHLFYMKVKTAPLIKTLSSNLRLLVLLRESLAAAGQTQSPLYAAVVAQANLTGNVLPNHERMTQAEVNAIRAQAGGAMGAEEKVQEAEQQVKDAKVQQVLSGAAKLPTNGEFQIMNPSTWKFKKK